MADDCLEPLLDAIGCVVGDELVGECGEPFDVGGDECTDQRVPRREVAIERADADAGTTGDLVERGIDALLLECGVGDVEESLLIASGVGAQRPRRSKRRGGGWWASG